MKKDLKNSVYELKEIIKKTLMKNAPQLGPEELTKRYVPRIEIAKILDISLPTLDDFIILNDIRMFRIGQKIVYRLDDLNDCIEEIITLKYGREQSW